MQFVIRAAQRRDVPAMLAIYAPYVRETTISFEYEPPTGREFMARFERIARRFPWILAEDDGCILGYAYADAPFERAAYQWNAELSVYIAPQWHRCGVGRALYLRIEQLLAALGYVRAHGVLTDENAASLAFHAALGYTEEARFRHVGFKFGCWHDVFWVGKALRDPGVLPPEPPLPWDGRAAVCPCP